MFTEGQYIFVGDTDDSNCGFWRTPRQTSEEAILEGRLLDRNMKLCTISFSHYRTKTNEFRGRT